MAINVVPWKIGDTIYEQFTHIRRGQMKNGVACTKGEILTKDSNGYLVKITASSGVAQLANGAFQAMESASAGSTQAASPTVQCMVSPSFIIMKAPANLVEGARVEVAAATSTPDPDKVKAAANAAPTAGFLGTVLEILSKDTNENVKLKTEDDDLIVVKMGVS